MSAEIKSLPRHRGKDMGGQKVDKELEGAGSLLLRLG